MTRSVLLSQFSSLDTELVAQQVARQATWQVTVLFSSLVTELRIRQ